MPDVAYLHQQLARGGTHGRWSDADLVAFERYDYRDGGSAADQTVVLFAMNDNYAVDISFDDGVCMDLTDFADALAADPDISAEDWDGKPFRYSPMEPIDADAADYDYYDFKPRRIKRAYAPQWVRAYYDYEDAQ